MVILMGVSPRGAAYLVVGGRGVDRLRLVGGLRHVGGLVGGLLVFLN